MASSLKKTANALSAESQLLNVHADLKAVAVKFESYLATIEAASKRILNWAERKEDERVQEFLQAVVELDMERKESDERANEHYKIFVKLWKGIISEKKELNAQLKNLDGARANLRDKTRKVAKAEQKEPVHKVEQRMTELEEAKAKEANVAAEVAQKLLEVQQDKHRTLRQGYTGLHQATMKRLREQVLIMEKLRILANTFPQVVARQEDGTYEHQPFDTSQEVEVWWQGDEINRQLQEVKGQHDEEKRGMQKQHNAKVDELVKRQEQMTAHFEKTRKGLLSNVAGEHAEYLESLSQEHAAQIAALQNDINNRDAAHAAAMADKDQQYGSLNQNLDGVKAQLMAQIDEVKRQLKAQIKETKKVETALQTANNNIITRSRKQAVDAIAHASIAAKNPCMNTFIDTAPQVRNAAEALALVLRDGLEGKCDIVHNRLSAFASGISMSLLSAAGAAQVSQAENSMELLTLLQPVSATADALLSCFMATDDDTDDHDPVPEEPEAKMVKAKFKHAGKVQDGFALIGFKKGAVLTLVKHRADGWSRIKSDTEEGWAPTSYLEDHVAEAKNTRRRSSYQRAAVADPQGAVVEFMAMYDAAIDKAKEIQVRDRELHKLSNLIANAIDSKVTAAQQSILDANSLFNKLLETSKATDTDRVLEVNTELLEKALKFEAGMERVINSSEGMRAALLRSRGSQTDSDFNQKHQTFFEALTASVDAVHADNPILCEAVRSVLARKGKHEELQVATRAINAAVARLSSMSLTKSMADTNEGGIQNHLSKNCKFVIDTGNSLLASARESQDLALASVLMDDFTKLSANNAKRLTMKTQVNVLKLEKELENEREKLGRLRRLTYEEW